MIPPKRVLIVDDEEDLTWGISRSLTKSYDFVVHCVHSGDEALRVLNNDSYDLVLSDIRMPGRDGLQLALDIQRNWPNTKIIIMTAHGSPQVRTEVKKVGDLFYIEKPFDIVNLKQMILEAFDSTGNTFNAVADA